MDKLLEIYIEISEYLIMKNKADPSPIETVSKQKFLHRFPIFQAVSLIAFFSFGLLTFWVKINPFWTIDLTITKIIQSINFPGFPELMRLVTRLADVTEGTISIFLVTLIALLLKEKKEAIMIAVSTVGAVYLSVLLKAFVSRPRPNPLLIIQVGEYLKSDSFPSGHVLFFMGFYGFLLFLVFTKLKRGLFRTILEITLVSLLILIGMSRIYLGAHWFSDTLGAYLIGIVWLYFMSNLYRRLKTKK